MAAIDTTPPEAVRAAAREGLALRKKYGRGGLSTQEAGKAGIGSGIARANSLAAGQKQGWDTIRRMSAFFSRHEKNKDTPPEKGNGKIAWLLWGGDPGRKWADGLLADREEVTVKHQTGRHNQKRHGYRSGDTNAIYSTAEKLIAGGQRTEAVNFLAKQAGTGYLPYAAIRGTAMGGLTKSELGKVRTSFANWAASWDKRNRNNPIESWRTMGARHLADFDFAVANQYKPPKRGKEVSSTPTAVTAQGPGSLFGNLPIGSRQTKRKRYSTRKRKEVFFSQELEAFKESGKRSGVYVTKDTSGNWRWITFSSNPYRDRDKEIVSYQALLKDVERADHDGHFGPLRWWHVPGVDLGECDYNAMLGRILVESGTFVSEKVARTIQENQHELGVSIGFTHPVGEPDSEGVFHNIRRFERSLCPQGRVSNLFTQFQV